MKSIVLVALTLLIVFIDASAQTKIANFGDDFSLNPTSSSWKYYWNKPNNWQAGSNPGDLLTGEIGTVSAYAPLISTGNMLSADGDGPG